MQCSLPVSGVADGLTQGRVQFREGRGCVVCGAAGMIKAEVSASCLLLPEKGDTVLIALTDSGEAWVLSVLRHPGADGEILLPSRAAFKSDTVFFDASNMDIHATHTNFTGKSLTVREDAVTVETGLLAMGGKVLLQGFSVMRRFARCIAETAFRQRGHYHSASQKVEDVAERKAGRVREESQGGYRVRAANMDMRAEGVMDIDASQIKVG